MTMQTFLKENRNDIDNCIRLVYGNNCTPTNDKERRDWVLNDEGLHLWAKREGVRI